MLLYPLQDKRLGDGSKEMRQLDPESTEAMDAVKEAQSVAKFLRQNLVQGVKAEGEDKYRTI